MNRKRRLPRPFAEEMPPVRIIMQELHVAKYNQVETDVWR